mgnify:CR=1 FL=1
MADLTSLVIVVVGTSICITRPLLVIACKKSGLDFFIVINDADRINTSDNISDKEVNLGSWVIPRVYINIITAANIIMIAMDLDNHKLYFGKNGTWNNSADPTSGATGTGALNVRGATKPQSLGSSQYSANASMLCNFGGYTTISISSAASDADGYGTFEYAPPSGYYALCTKNLEEFG